MKIALCQLNPVTGDIRGNTRLVIDAVASMRENPPDLAVFSELFLQGYPPRDLLECDWFINAGTAAVKELCVFSKSVPATAIVVGSAVPTGLRTGKGLYNAALLIHNGAVVFQQNKSLLPSYDVFDETRYFDAAESVKICRFKGEKLGITICEDAWNHRDMWDRPLYPRDPVDELARKGATLMVNISGSPFHSGKEKLRQTIVRRHAKVHAVAFVFVNQVGGNDELIFDGGSMFFDAAGRMRARIPLFKEGVQIVDTQRPGPVLRSATPDAVTNIYDALVLGVRDYLKKCGFKKALIGLSGGIDSAVTACIAVAAIGAENVLGVAMPSRYSSEGSVTDARKLATNLGIAFEVIPIEKPFSAYLESLKTAFGGKPADLTEENLQARVRGTILMALSNKHGHIVLTTGNKSEMSVGYCTLYGDMNGGLAVISDLPKSMVYKVAHYVNREREVIPPDTITKPPSAELRPDQKDQDSLPEYDLLDRILAGLVEEKKSQKEIVRSGADPHIVAWVARAIRTTEYKRRQAAPGLKVTPKAFGSGRRFPLAARYDFS